MDESKQMSAVMYSIIGGAGLVVLYLLKNIRWLKLTEKQRIVLADRIVIAALVICVLAFTIYYA